MAVETTSFSEENMNLERLKSLYELISRMNSVHNLQELLEFVVDRVLSLTSGSRGLLLLSDDHKASLNDVAVVRGGKLGQQDIERILKRVSTTIIQDVLERGEARLVMDLSTDKRFEGMTSNDTLFNKRVRSVLAVPLKAEGKAVGLLYIDHPAQAVFGQGELEFLTAFANQAALAINRTRAYHHQIEKLTMLNVLSRSVVKVLDLNEVLTRIVTEVTHMLNVEASSVLLLDEATAELTFATSVYDGERLSIPTRLNKEQGIAGWVMTHGTAVYANDVMADPRWYGEVETGFITTSLLCVPLQTDGRTLGVLQAMNKKSEAKFDAGDITLLSAFAASATIAIENARLFQEVQQARQLRALNEIALKLSSTLDLNKILDEGLEQALEVLQAEAGAIGLVNDETNTDLLAMHLSHKVPLDSSQKHQQTQALGGFACWVLSIDVPAFLPDEIFVIDDAHPEPDDIEPQLSAAGIKAMAMTPIRVSGAISGGLAVISTTPCIYDQNQLSLLSSIARIVGLASQNAIHYLKLQNQTRHLTYLNEFGGALTRSLDQDHVLEVIIQGVNTLVQTELTSIFLIDAETNELVLRYSTKGNAEIRLPAPWQGIAGWVATNDEPAVVNNTDSDPRHLRQIAIETGYKAESILCVPLKVEGQVIGVVEVLNKTGGQPFTAHHQTLLEELTRWAAIALHNARLYNDRWEAFQRLNTEQQRRITAETRGAMAAVILDIAHTMNNVVGAIRAWAMALEYALTDSPQSPLLEFDKMITKIRQNTEEAIKLMSTMTGPLEQAAVAPVNIHHCLDAAIRSCWWPESVRLIKQYAADLPSVEANAERLEAVFHNLLSNAVQALTLQGGEIRLYTAYTEANWVEININDNGPGIPPDLQERVFNPGVTGKIGGLGIGLWLADTFVHQINGQINFVSSPEEGTTFTVKLPAITRRESINE